MREQKITVLGIPVDNLTLDESVQTISGYIDGYARGKKSHYVGTINSGFLINAQSCGWSAARYPELLAALRECGVAVPDGSSVVWLSRLMHCPFKERVRAVDLFPQLAGALAVRQQSIFLLGGEERAAKAATDLLAALYPGLKIAGSASPYIYADGADLENAPERDELVIEQINAAAPHLLVVNIGSPKQEIWFRRIKDRLRVPVVLGVDDALAGGAAASGQIPGPMRRTGMAWLWRFFKEPGKLWSHYVFKGLKLLIQAAPLVMYHNINYFVWKTIHGGARPALQHPLLFLSQDQALAVVPFPGIIDSSAAIKLDKYLEESFNQDAIVLDFHQVRHITLEGLSFLVELCRKAREANKDVFALGINADMRLLLRMHRVWDLIQDIYTESPHGVLDRLAFLRNRPSFFESIQQDHERVIISFFGSLSQGIDYEKHLGRLAPILSGKDCLLDFQYCTNIESRGFSFLLQVREFLSKEGTALSIRGLNRDIAWLFRLHKVQDLFKRT